MAVQSEWPNWRDDTVHDLQGQGSDSQVLIDDVSAATSEYLGAGADPNDGIEHSSAVAWACEFR